VDASEHRAASLCTDSCLSLSCRPFWVAAAARLRASERTLNLHGRRTTPRGRAAWAGGPEREEVVPELPRRAGACARRPAGWVDERPSPLGGAGSPLSARHQEMRCKARRRPSASTATRRPLPITPPRHRPERRVGVVGGPGRPVINKQVASVPRRRQAASAAAAKRADNAARGNAGGRARPGLGPGRPPPPHSTEFWTEYSGGSADGRTPITGPSGPAACGRHKVRGAESVR